MIRPPPKNRSRTSVKLSCATLPVNPSPSAYRAAILSTRVESR